MLNHIYLFAASACSPQGGILTLPNWYSYLPGTMVNGQCQPVINNLTDIWLIVLAVIDMLLQLVALITIVMVIYGGVQMMTSQGQPDRVGIINAIIGAFISIAAAATITFLAGNIH
jgi:hypothetical protein